MQPVRAIQQAHYSDGGLPGMISNGDGASMFIRPGENGLVRSAADMQAQLPALLRRVISLSTAERQACGTAASETMLTLAWPHHLEKWMDLIRSLPPRGIARE